MSLEDALKENTAALQALTAVLSRNRESQPVVTVEKHGTHSGDGSASPSGDNAKASVGESAKAAAGVSKVDGEVITYDALSKAFLAVIKKLGTAAAAKAAVLTPLGLEDLKSNSAKVDLFPAIMERINKAMKDEDAGSLV